MTRITRTGQDNLYPDTRSDWQRDRASAPFERPANLMIGSGLLWAAVIVIAFIIGLSL